MLSRSCRLSSTWRRLALGPACCPRIRSSARRSVSLDLRPQVSQSRTAQVSQVKLRPRVNRSTAHHVSAHSQCCCFETQLPRPLPCLPSAIFPVGSRRKIFTDMPPLPFHLHPRPLSAPAHQFGVQHPLVPLSLRPPPPRHLPLLPHCSLSQNTVQHAKRRASGSMRMSVT